MIIHNMLAIFTGANTDHYTELSGKHVLQKVMYTPTAAFVTHSDEHTPPLSAASLSQFLKRQLFFLGLSGKTRRASAILHSV